MKRIFRTSLCSYFVVALAIIFTPELAKAGQSAFIPGSHFCLPNYRKWNTRDRHWKAFTLNIWNSNGQVCGWAGGYPSKQAAIARAMRECQKNAKRTPSFGLKSSCYVFDVK
jgi:uncharacterized protein YegP (UPF0339 family)